MVLCVHGEVTDPDVDVFDREAVFIDRVLSGVVRDFPELKIVFEHITTAEAADFVRDAGAERRRDDHAAASHHQSQCHVRRRAYGRTLIACRSPSARSTGWRCARRRPRARPNSSSAPTALRTRAKPRNRAAAAPASSTRRSRSKAMRRCSRKKMRSTGSKPSPRNMDANFYGLPLNEGTVTLERSSVDVPEDDRGRRAVPCRRDAALEVRGLSACRRARWCRSPQRNALRQLRSIRRRAASGRPDREPGPRRGRSSIRPSSSKRRDHRVDGRSLDAKQSGKRLLRQLDPVAGAVLRGAAASARLARRWCGRRCTRPTA